MFASPLRSRRAISLVGLCVALALTGAACGNDDDAASDTTVAETVADSQTAPAEDTLALEDTVPVDSAAAVPETEVPGAASTDTAVTTDSATADSATTDSAATTDTSDVAASDTVPAVSGDAAASADCPAADGSAPVKREFAAYPPMCIDAAKTYTVTMETTKGTMKFNLFAAKAPKTVNSFVVLARHHYFDGIIFHRVVPGFVIQGGDPQGIGNGGPGYQFEDELPQAGEYKIGSLAMANAGPNTNGSQFFIITGANGAGLPPNYSLFGELIEGQEVAAAIDKLGQPDPNPPLEKITMTKVTISEA